MSKKKPSRSSSKRSSSKRSSSKRSSSKPKHKHPAARAHKAASSAAENVVKLGTHAVHDFISAHAGEAQKAHEKVFAIGRESADNFARSADAAAKGVNEAFAISRENIEACVECTNLAADMTRTLSTEALNFANEMLAQNMEISKEAMACRSFGDFFELQNKAIRHTLDQLFNESSRFSEMFFQYASEAAEPLNGRMMQATERLSKVVAA